MSAPIILSLCDRTGNWPRPYLELGGYEVVSVDLADAYKMVDGFAHGGDVRLMLHWKSWAGRVRGILAAPPCTVFCRSGAWVKRPADALTDALAVVDACLRAVAIYKPAWWALENPPGKLSNYLGPPAFTFQPWEFGDPWTKRTCLWGSFSTALKRTPVKPKARIDQMYSGTQERERGLRSATPMGFARAFCEANP